MDATSFVGCAAARTLCSISYNGNVYPCSYIGDDYYLAGNIYTESLQSIWENAEIFKKFRTQKYIEEPCNSCDKLSICFGGCRAYAIGVNGFLHSVDEGCWRGIV